MVCIGKFDSQKSKKITLVVYTLQNAYSSSHLNIPSKSVASPLQIRCKSHSIPNSMERIRSGLVANEKRTFSPFTFVIDIPEIPRNL